MKITNVRSLSLSRPHERERQWVTARYRTIKADASIVVIDTDEGVQGIGEACAYGEPARIGETVEWLRPELVDQNPLDPATAPHPNGRTRTFDCAVAGIDTALWDLRGKAEGEPVSKMINPDAPESVAFYASSGCRYDWRHNPEQLIEEALEYVEQGITAEKVRIGTEWSWDGVTVDRFIGQMRELAQAVDGRMGLALDGNQRLSEEQALQIGRELDRLGFIWFEEPIPQTDIDGYARLNEALDLPVTGGEQFTTVEQFMPYLQRGSYDIIQPDIAWCGVTEGIKLAQLAERYGVGVRPHSWHNGLMGMANGHYVTAVSSDPLLEICMIQGPLQWEILAEKPRIEDGRLHFTGRPGLGVELADGLEERFPYIEGHYAVEVSRQPIPTRY